MMLVISRTYFMRIVVPLTILWMLFMFFMIKRSDAHFTISVLEKQMIEYMRSLSRNDTFISESKWTEYITLDMTGKLGLLVREKASTKDPRLLDLIRKYYIEFPSNKPYALSNPMNLDYSCGQSSYINGLLNSALKLNAASDMSRTIERKEDKQWVREHNFDQRPYYEVPCFPLYSIMLAINRTSIDYFGLDVEGNELQILETIPFDDLDIKSLTVECLGMHGRGNESAKAVKMFLESKGFGCHGIIKASAQHSCFAEDLVFVQVDLVPQGYQCGYIKDPFNANVTMQS